METGDQAGTPNEPTVVEGGDAAPEPTVADPII